jgi:hypothetical protein
LGQVAEWVGQSVAGYRGERVARPTERIGLREGDEILRYAQDDRRRERVKREFVGCGLKLRRERGKRKKQVPRFARNDNSPEFRLARNDNSREFRHARNDNSWGFRRAGGWVGLVGHAEWPARSRSEDRPVHAERIRCSWGALEGAAMGRVVGRGCWAWVRGWAGREATPLKG